MKARLRHPIPDSPEGDELKRAGEVLKRKHDNPNVMDLSQGNPAREPVADAKWQMTRILAQAPMGQYSSQVIPNVFVITALRYFLKQGVDIDALVEDGIKNGFYKVPEEAIASLETVRTLVNSPDISGVQLFERSAPTSQRHFNELAEAISKLSIIGGANNSRDAVSTAMNLFEGEYVLTARGFYHSFSRLPSMVGKSWELLDTLGEENYKLTADILQKWCESNPDKVGKVSSLLLIDPSNPSGAVYSASEKKAIAEVCASHNIPIIEDMIYSGIVREGVESVPMAKIAPDNTIAFSSMGKYFGAPDLRVGCVVGPPQVIQPFTEYIRTQTGFVSNMMAACAAAVMELTPGSYFAENNREYAKRIAVVRNLSDDLNTRMCQKFPQVGETVPFIKTNNPEGGFFVLAQFPRLKGKYYEYDNGVGRKIGIIQDSVDVSKFFIDYRTETEEGVRMPPTVSSGVPGDRFEVRISVGDNDCEKVQHAFSRIGNALDNLMVKQEKYRSDYERQQRMAAVNSLGAH